jgi:hypothetical protein
MVCKPIINRFFWQLALGLGPNAPHMETMPRLNTPPGQTIDQSSSKKRDFDE